MVFGSRGASSLLRLPRLLKCISDKRDVSTASNGHGNEATKVAPGRENSKVSIINVNAMVSHCTRKRLNTASPTTHDRTPGGFSHPGGGAGGGSLRVVAGEDEEGRAVRNGNDLVQGRLRGHPSGLVRVILLRLELPVILVCSVTTNPSGTEVERKKNKTRLIKAKKMLQSPVLRREKEKGAFSRHRLSFLGAREGGGVRLGVVVGLLLVVVVLIGDRVPLPVIVPVRCGSIEK